MTRFFCPGRVELAGNHTDHQRGRVMAAAMDMGITAEAEPNDEGVARVSCEGFGTIAVELDKLWPDEKERGASAALVRGVAAGLAETGLALRGFDAYLFSDLPPGQGLASSTAFTVLTGFILAAFAGAQVTPEELARMAQKAESRWFGKAAGPADALACAMGGGVYVDVLEGKLVPIDCDFDSLGLAMALTATGGSALDAEQAYAQIAADMTDVANLFGEPFLAKIRGPVFDARWQEHTGERKWRRARHFFDETWRVSSMADALGLRDGQRYMELMNQSGRSSELLLKNIWSEQSGDGLIWGLEESGRLLDGVGAWRVHSGGFAGYVQALMPEQYFDSYRAAMDAMFGPGACRRIRVVPRGVRLAQEEKRLFARESAPEQAVEPL